MKIIVLFTFLFSFDLWAQTRSEIPTVEVSAQQESLEASHFPQAPLESLPLSSHHIDETTKEEAHILKLSDVTRVDASASDSYNASGYWDFLNVRGYTLDNRFSYLREGLPINAETSIPLDNKKSIEILKGLSGMQTGASSPGGVVNLTVLRPPASGAFQKVLSSTNDESGFLIGADIGGRGERNGYRGMGIYEDLKPAVNHSQGSRYLASYAHDFRFNERTLLQFEIENSKRSQPSQSSLSLLGHRIPSPQPKVNLNNQPWSAPVVFGAWTGTVGLHHRFSESWQGSVVLGIQELVTDDRLAYAYGCSAENNFDRYCSDGTFDVYDFRSENERRRTEAFKATLHWNGFTGSVSHALEFGMLGSRSQDRFERQAYNYVGVGNIDGTAILPENPSLNDENTNRDSNVVDAFVFDSLRYQSWGLWLGARSSSIERSSVRTDASRATQYHENFVLPWAALSYDFTNTMVYFSYGEGVETFVTPNRATYTNPGQFVDDVRSHQYELGLRASDGKSWSFAVFEIHRPVVADLAPEYRIDGKALHRGLEVAAQTDMARWTLGASGMILEAKREGSTLQSELNGLRPVNVPKSTGRAFADYRVNADLKLTGLFSYEDDRAVTSDNSLLLSSWTRWDLGASYQWRWAQGLLQAHLFVENILDTKFWKESPTQYGHIYLYPGHERTLFLSASYRF